MAKEQGLLASGRVTLLRIAASMAIALAIAALVTGCAFMRDYRSCVHSEQAFTRGAKAMERRDFAAADRDFTEALRAQPDSASAYYTAVVAKYSKSSRAPMALFKLGKLAERNPNRAGARAYYQAVIDRYPQSDEAKLARDALRALP